MTLFQNDLQPDHAGEPDSEPAPLRLAGRSAWIITDGTIGIEIQAISVARELRLDYALKRINPRQPWRSLAPWGPLDLREGFGALSGSFSPPWPEIAIGGGRQGVPYLRMLRKKAGGKTFTVVLQNPRTGLKTADLIWVPAHDRLSGKNVFTTLVSAHPHSPERLERLRRSPPPDIAGLPNPRIAVVLGGPNSAYRFTEQANSRLALVLRSLAELGASFMITPSRRSASATVAAAAAATKASPRIFWEGCGKNPYPHFLSAADYLLVTADSVNMTGEACATGRPVYVFKPDGGSPKFTRFHEALKRYGATRSLSAPLERLESWRYEPLHATPAIAAEIEHRWRQAFQARRMNARKTGRH